MALDKIEQYIPRNNDFYRDHYHHLLMGLIACIVFLMLMVGVFFYQVMNRPLPQFNAVEPDGKSMLLISSNEPNLLPDTILRWASKAATVAYTFDFVGYNAQIKAARPYFTELGWQDYLNSVNRLINNIIQSKLFINGVVSGTPVISNQGEVPGTKYPVIPPAAPPSMVPLVCWLVF